MAGDYDVADTGEFRDVYKILAGCLKGRTLVEDWEGTTIWKLEGVDWIEVTQQDGIW